MSNDDRDDSRAVTYEHLNKARHCAGWCVVTAEAIWKACLEEHRQWPAILNDDTRRDSDPYPTPLADAIAENVPIWKHADASEKIFLGYSRRLCDLLQRPTPEPKELGGKHFATWHEAAFRILNDMLVAIHDAAELNKPLWGFWFEQSHTFSPRLNDCEYEDDTRQERDYAICRIAGSSSAWEAIIATYPIDLAGQLDRCGAAINAEFIRAAEFVDDIQDNDEAPPEWRDFDRWAAENLTPTERDHVRALYSGPVENDALGALHGCPAGEHSRGRVNRLNSAIRKKLPDGYEIKSDGRRGSAGETRLFGP